MNITPHLQSLAPNVATAAEATVTQFEVYAAAGNVPAAWAHNVHPAVMRYITDTATLCARYSAALGALGL